MMTYDEALSITESVGATTNDLRYIGPNGTTANSAQYFLATTISPESTYEWTIGTSGAFDSTADGYSLGIRPVVELKPNILTTGKGIDYVGQEAWTLVKP